MVLVGAPDRLIALLQFLHDVQIARHRQESREPVVVLDDLVRDLARRDLARLTHHQRHAKRAFPIGVLLAAERRHGAVRPGVHVRAIVGRIHDEGVVGDAELIEIIERLADILVVVDHSLENRFGQRWYEPDQPSRSFEGARAARFCPRHEPVVIRTDRHLTDRVL
jgi:hypothetical protein